MGWTIYDRANSPQTYAEEKREIQKLCTFESDDRKAAPVQVSKVGSVWYAAVKVLPKAGKTLDASRGYIADSDGGYTFAAVFLTTKRGGEWGYKDIDETMGPNESRAPMSLINRLSDLTDPESYAAKWRNRCEVYAANKPPALNDGDVIKIHPITLTDGTQIQNFRVWCYPYRGKTRKAFRCLDNGSDYRLTRSHLQGLSVVSRNLNLGVANV